MSTSVRQLVRDLLAPMIPVSWDIQAHTVKKILTLSRPTLYIEHTGITPLPTAPMGSLQNTCVVTILDHHTDYAKAENALDDDVLELITAIDAHDRLGWEKADKTEVLETYLGWAITLTVITEKE